MRLWLHQSTDNDLDILHFKEHCKENNISNIVLWRFIFNGRSISIYFWEISLIQFDFDFKLPTATGNRLLWHVRVYEQCCCCCCPMHAVWLCKTCMVTAEGHHTQAASAGGQRWSAWSRWMVTIAHLLSVLKCYFKRWWFMLLVQGR